MYSIYVCDYVPCAPFWKKEKKEILFGGGSGLRKSGVGARGREKGERRKKKPQSTSPEPNSHATDTAKSGPEAPRVEPIRSSPSFTWAETLSGAEAHY